MPVVSIRMTRPERDALAALAAARRGTVSDYVRGLIRCETQPLPAGRSVNPAHEAGLLWCDDPCPAATRVVWRPGDRTIGPAIIFGVGPVP